MLETPWQADLAFIPLVVVLVGLAMAAASGVSPRARHATGAVLALWMLVTAEVANRGWLLDTDALPPAIFRLVAVPFVAAFLIALTPLGGRLARSLPAPALVGFQTFRVVMELILWGLALAHVIPERMSFEGWNFDVLVGLTAPIAAWWASTRGRRAAPALIAWNLAGLALLATIVAIAVASAPGPLRAFTDEPANRMIFSVPFVWLPTLVVPMAMLGHLLSLRQQLQILRDDRIRSE